MLTTHDGTLVLFSSILCRNTYGRGGRRQAVGFWRRMLGALGGAGVMIVMARGWPGASAGGYVARRGAGIGPGDHWQGGLPRPRGALFAGAGAVFVSAGPAGEREHRAGDQRRHGRHRGRERGAAGGAADGVRGAGQGRAGVAAADVL